MGYVRGAMVVVALVVVLAGVASAKPAQQVNGCFTQEQAAEMEARILFAISAAANANPNSTPVPLRLCRVRPDGSLSCKSRTRLIPTFNLLP